MDRGMGGNVSPQRTVLDPQGVPVSGAKVQILNAGGS